MPNDLLQLRGLRYAYATPDGKTRPVLDLPSFSLAPGSQVALEGSSGSGKTTLLNLIAGLLKAAPGMVTLDGQDLGALDESDRDALRGRLIGLVQQTFNLLQGLTAFENVTLAQRLGGAYDPERAEALLKRVGLGDRLEDLPGRMSVGQQQRVAVARALACKPALILADEPTGNLDAATGREVLALLRGAAKESGAALLLVSHDPAVLKQFKQRLKLGTLNKVSRRAKP
jgi:putative ABC transport system ATP-binding protein